MARSHGTPLTPERIAEIRAYRQTHTLKEVAERFGYKGTGAVSNIVNYGTTDGPGRQRARGVNVQPIRGFGWGGRKTADSQFPSLKQRILRSLNDKRAATPGEIRMRIPSLPGESIDLHHVVHLLWALQKQGAVTFREDKRAATGGAVSTLYDIQITDTGRRILNGKPEKQLEKQPEAIEEPKLAPVAKPPDQVRALGVPPLPATDYPLIMALLKRRTNVGAAARLLREAGLEDEAALAEANLKFSPLEEEVVRLIRAKGIEVK